MSPAEIGALILRLQNDDLKSYELRRLIKELMTDAEVRENVRLVGLLADLPVEVRQAYCVANITFLVSDKECAPEAAPDPSNWADATTQFSAVLYTMMRGPWEQHLKISGKRPTAQEILQARKSKMNSPIAVQLSPLLRSHCRALEDFWGTPGLLVR